MNEIENNYIELFNNSYSKDNPSIKLEDKFCGKASLYEISLRWLKVIQESSSSKNEAGKTLSKKLEHLVPELKKIVFWCHHYNGISFVDSLLHWSPNRFVAPEKMGRIKLGNIGISLLGEMLLRRLDRAVNLAFRHMRFDNKREYDVNVLYDKEPTYFEWKSNTSEVHMEFVNDLVSIYRNLDDTTVTDVINKIKEENKNREKDKIQRKKENMDTKLKPLVKNNKNNDRDKKNIKGKQVRNKNKTRYKPKQLKVNELKIIKSNQINEIVPRKWETVESTEGWKIQK